MTEFERLMEQGLKEAEGMFSTNNTIKIGASAPVACIFSDSPSAQGSGIGGWTEETEGVAIVRKSVLAVAPKSETNVVIGGKTFLVDKVENDHPSWNIYVKGKNQ